MTDDGRCGPTIRLDVALAARGLAVSRTRARRLIEEGRVLVDGHVERRPSTSVWSGRSLELRNGDDYVSRGALKLVGAFEAFASHGLRDPRGLDCLDIGASTGGFTQVLLRRGARRVVALDVGHGQLDARLAGDPRVVEMSGVNVRDLEAGDLPFRPAMVVGDVSFISLRYVLPVARRVIAEVGDAVLLVKPQFEVGRGRLGRHGVVRDPQERLRAVDGVVDAAEREGFTVVGVAPSPIEGMHGNVEYLLCLSVGRAAPGVGASTCGQGGVGTVS
ncbi:TlyA family RNA methyltransferase [uncultured Bifidobacterium sp.]|uniref:TlyA family RNA methyltransferase n=1 Tax=uncultured Bifidobacterium sp. TaxID=165187 RepID=UPI0028DCE20A|nr:TlyA family RNA methyltransferase [uncultured Bifidobacterium sp.]